MNKQILSIATLAGSMLCAGCVGTGPNTQQGAVTGGALGALAGAIIGHNSRGGDALGGAILGAEMGALAGGTLGNSVDHERGTLYGYPQPYGNRRSAQSMPPPEPPAPPQTDEAVTAPPSPNALWIPGYWSFDGYHYSWIAGHWEVPPPNARIYVTAHWENRGNGYAYIPGYWR